MSVVVRRLVGPEEFLEAVEVQARAWSMDDYREAAPAHLLRALADNGGLVLGAFIGGRLVGVSYGWPVFGGGYFYSHATGVDGSVKYRGVGFLLKVFQRRFVLEDYGLSLAKWTFDPLQGLNSRFNLGKLGVVVGTYLVNYYGEIRDNINRGLGTDRAKAEWYLRSRRVEVRLSGGARPDSEALEELLAMEPCIAVRVEGDPPRPVGVDTEVDCDVVVLPIPRSISEVRDRGGVELAREWRLATRRVYSALLGRGYLLVDSIRVGEGLSYNVLWRRSLESVLSGLEPWRR